MMTEHFLLTLQSNKKSPLNLSGDFFIITAFGNLIIFINPVNGIYQPRKVEQDRK